MVLIVYVALSYSILHCEYNLDFTSFYKSAAASVQGHNPYHAWMADNLPVVRRASINLNPPVSLFLFRPFAYLNYPTAMFVWLALSFIFGLIGAWLSFRYAFSQAFIKKNRDLLYFIYLSLFSSLMSFSAVQVGTCLLLCVMAGYHYYLKENDYIAGIFWGFIISLKLFPALLILYVIKQRRLKVLASIITTVTVCLLLPLIFFGPIVYQQYFTAMTNISWYQNSWNGSICGCIYRCFTELQQPQLILPVYLLLFCCGIIAYFCSMATAQRAVQFNHQPFCLTLVMMLLLSPLGWIYYFTILLFPLLLIWARLMNEPEAFSLQAKIVCICFFFINFPIKNKSDIPVYGSTSEQLIISSFYFIGLVLLACLLMLNKKQLYGCQEFLFTEQKNSFSMILFILLMFGLLIPGTGFLMRLTTYCIY